MRIRFECTMEDVLAFSDFHYQHSPMVNRFIFWYRLIGALTIVLLPSVLIQVLVPDVPLLFRLAVSLLCAIGFAFRASAIIKRRMRKQTLKLYNEGKNSSFLGKHALELTDTGLITRSEYTETKLAWGAIERIEASPDYTFLYISSVQAYVIPHNRIYEGDFRALMSELGRRFQPGQKLPQIP